jgi:hypothetical protein
MSTAWPASSRIASITIATQQLPPGNLVVPAHSHPPAERDVPGAAAMLCASTAQVPSTLITAHIVNKLGRI